MSIEDLELKVFQFVSIAEENCNEEWFKELDEAGVELIDALRELKRYKDKEEQGLLIELPCKVGDKLYQPAFGNVKEYTLIGVVYDIFQKKWHLEIAFEVCGKWTKGICERDDIGRIVFLTRSEAEEALAKMGGK